jgi:DNA-binding MarR family transcriptional regulator
MSQATLAEFADQVNEIMPMFMKELFNRQPSEFIKFKLTMPQFFILNLLFKQGASNMTTIAHFMNVSTAAITGIVDRLVKYGYVVRVSEPGDRRVVKVRLTPQGLRLVMRGNEKKRQMMVDIFSKISQREREEYLKILMHIRDILSAQKSDEGSARHQPA